MHAHTNLGPVGFGLAMVGIGSLIGAMPVVEMMDRHAVSIGEWIGCPLAGLAFIAVGAKIFHTRYKTWQREREDRALGKNLTLGRRMKAESKMRELELAEKADRRGIRGLAARVQLEKVRGERERLERAAAGEKARERMRALKAAKEQPPSE